MNSLISTNKKFMSINPKRLCEILLSYKYTKGIEIYIDYNNEDEVKYLNDLVYEIKRNNLLLQVHGEITLDINKQIEYLKKLESYSDYLGYPIIFTLHTIYDDNKNISMNKTIEYINNLITNIDSSKIIISLENLNDIRGYVRLGKEEIKPLVLNDEKIFFTYDIGHEISDYGLITNLDGYMFSDIRNVHLHSISSDLKDHMPIYKNDKYWNNIMKSIEFLILNKYKYNIVYEYGLEYCHGNTVEEKLNDYLFSIDLVSEKYSG
ncbi:MAG: hypothetical protein IKX00_02415 [Bacilli bacterium]|nr:hypothetical protein [Bacilli bacterium]